MEHPWFVRDEMEKKSGEIPTDGGHRLYFSGKEDKHEQGVGFLVHKDIVKSVIGCRPVSTLPSFRYMHQHPAMMTLTLMSSTGNSSL